MRVVYIAAFGEKALSGMWLSFYFYIHVWMGCATRAIQLCKRRQQRPCLLLFNSWDSTRTEPACRSGSSGIRRRRRISCIYVYTNVHLIHAHICKRINENVCELSRRNRTHEMIVYCKSKYVVDN